MVLSILMAGLVSAGTITTLSSTEAALGFSEDAGIYTVTQPEKNLGYSSSGNGLVSVSFGGEHQFDFGYALYAKVNGTPYFLKSWDAAWNWSILSNTDDNVTIHADTSYNNFIWEQDWYFSRGETKIVNYFENNTGFGVGDLMLYYILDLNEANKPNLNYYNESGDDLNYTWDNYYYNNNKDQLNSFLPRVKAGNWLFNFQDLRDDNFDFNVLFLGNLSLAHGSLPDTNGIIVGVTKGSQILIDGQGIVLDPLIETDFGSVTVSNVTNLKCDVYAFDTATTFYTSFTKDDEAVIAGTTDSGDTWDVSTGISPAGESSIRPCLLKASDKYHAIWWNQTNNTMEYSSTPINPTDNNILNTDNWNDSIVIHDNNTSIFSVDINSGNYIHVAYVGTPDLNVVFGDADNNLSAADFGTIGTQWEVPYFTGTIDGAAARIKINDNDDILLHHFTGNTANFLFFDGDTWSSEITLGGVVANSGDITAQNGTIYIISMDDNEDPDVNFCSTSCDNLDNWSDLNRDVMDAAITQNVGIGSDDGNNLYFYAPEQVTQLVFYNQYFDANGLLGSQRDGFKFIDTNFADRSPWFGFNQKPSNNIIPFLIIDTNITGRVYFEKLDSIFQVATEVTVTTLDGEDFNGTMSPRSYAADLNLTIDFDVKITGSNPQADINFSTSQTEGTGEVIIENIDLTTTGVCAGTIGTWARCSWDWNTIQPADINSTCVDSNCFINILVTSDDGVDFNTSLVNFMVDMNAPTIQEDTQVPETDIHNGDDTTPTFSIRIIDGDGESNASGCFFNVLIQDGIDSNANFIDVNSDGWCNHTRGTGLSENDKMDVHWIPVDTADNNGSIFFSKTYTLNTIITPPGSPGGGDGGVGGGGGVAGIPAKSDFDFIPKLIDKYFFYIPFINPEAEFKDTVKANKILKTCVAEEPFTCEIEEEVFMNFTLPYNDDINWFRVVKTQIQGRDEDGLIGFLPVTVRAVNIGFWLELRGLFQLPANTIPLVTDNAWIFKIENGVAIGLRLWWIAGIILIILGIVASFAILEASASGS